MAEKSHGDRADSKLVQHARGVDPDSTHREEEDTSGQGTVVRCPHCGEQIALQKDRAVENEVVICPNCDSDFNLLFELETVSRRSEPRRIGHYQLLEHLGSGQFGNVWKALDTKLDRIVAIKIPRRSDLTSEGPEVFLREARAAAQLTHPHIVAVHEIGQADGVIYITSDFVHGADLRAWLSNRQLTATEAAQLCVTLADALEHAHRAGVIHRDLKPANVMMDLEGRPHVMDFGLAKRSTGEVTVTLEGQILGTPAYMSPEQARGEAHNVDGRADIYSLGVLLFELLTGELPFRGEKRMLMVQIISDDPPSPRKLNSHIPRDLETICLKCLEKNPDRRYPTAGDLAADLRRWLRREPIVARPIGRFHRWLRWCQRRPAVASLLATVIAITFVGFSLVTWQWRHARAQYMEVLRQQERGDQYHRELLNVIDEMLVDVGAEQLKDEPGMQGVRRDLVEKALEYYDWSVQQEEDSPRVRSRQALARLQGGKLRVWLGEFGTAASELQRFLSELDQLPADSMDEETRKVAKTEGILELSNAYVKLGKTQDAETLLSNLLVQLNAGRTAAQSESLRLLAARTGIVFGEILIQQERRDEAERAFEQALTRLQDPTDSDSHEIVALRFQLLHDLALCLGSTPRFDEAQRYFEEALRLKPQLLDGGRLAARSLVAGFMADYALYLERTDQMDSATRIREEAIELQQQLVEDYPEVPAMRRGLAILYQNQGAALAKCCQVFELDEKEREKLSDEADLAFQNSTSLLDDLRHQYSNVPEYGQLLAGTYNLWSHSLDATGQTGAAVDCLEKARTMWKQMLEGDPDNAMLHSDFGGVLNNLALLYRKLDRLSEAREMVEEAIRHQEQARLGAPAQIRCLEYLANHYLTMARICRQQADYAKAEAAFEKSVQLREELYATMENDWNRRGLGGVVAEYGGFFLDVEDESVVNVERAIDLLHRAFEITPDFRYVQFHLGRALAEAAQWDELLTVLEGLPNDESASAYQRAWAAAWSARALAEGKQAERARILLQQARSHADGMQELEDISAYLTEIEHLLEGEKKGQNRTVD